MKYAYSMCFGYDEKQQTHFHVCLVGPLITCLSNPTCFACNEGQTNFIAIVLIYTYTRGLSFSSTPRELSTQYHRSTTLPIDDYNSEIVFDLDHLHRNPARMISTKRLVQMARKWQKMAARGRKRISFGVVPKSNSRKKVA
uniref:Uncharacterized protein n=1 Tax=Nymphaea colorata TaxID=210225 RepID=A0A5K1A274_9MAGN